MGHKRKRQGAKNKKAKKAVETTEPTPSAGTSSTTLPAQTDEGYTHYNSDGDEPNNNSNEPLASDDDDDDDQGDDDQDVEMGLGDTQQNESDVEVTLDFYDPSSADDASIQNFLVPFLKRLPSANSPSLKQALSQTICGQTRVGTTIKVEDDEAPVGFISCLNARSHREMLRPLLSALGKKDGGEKKLFSNVVARCIDPEKGKFEGEKMGVLVTERVVNIPPLVIPKLLEAVFCEIEWAVEDEPTPQLREEFRFGWYLYISEAFIAPDGAADDVEDGMGTEKGKGNEDGEKKKKKKSKKKQKVDLNDLVDNDDSFQYVKVEDYAWFKYASHKLLWPLAAEQEQADGSKPTGGRIGIAMIIAAKNIPKVRQMVEAVVGAIEQPDEENGTKDAMET